jgi:peptide chain release factor 1
MAVTESGSFSKVTELLLEVRFGEGGDDSKLFVQELFAAYALYAKRKNLAVEIVSSDDSHISATVRGAGAGEAFQYESGKHCVQRIPENDRKSRKQTSIVAVAVLPIKTDVAIPQLRDSDLQTETCGGHGPGGQHQNATDSAVRMKHVPTGIVVFINGRDQKYNKITARRVLTARVYDKLKSESDAEYAALRKEQLGDAGRGDKVRTYNFLKSQATDHRFNVKTGNIKPLMKGQFELLFPKK